MVEDFIAILTEEIHLATLHTQLALAEAQAGRARRLRKKGEGYAAFHQAVLDIDRLKDEIDEVDSRLARARGRVENRQRVEARRVENIRLFRKYYLRR